MYASLGDIVFEALISFDALSDQRETKYSEIALINGKPGLQRNGESLIKFSMSIQFHVSFCNPEDEYLKLNNARIAGTILPFIYGNGFNEGDYVITNLDRTVNQTDAKGNFVEIVCNLSLLEYAGSNAAAKQIEQDKKNAFAVSSNRPLPATPQMQMTNPALLASQENKNVLQSTSKIGAATDKVKKSVDIINTGLIDKAQKFVDQIADYSTKINTQVGQVNNSLGNINALITAFGSITGIAPNLSPAILDVQSSLADINIQLSVLQALPTTITTTGQATGALTELTNTLNVINTLKDNSNKMNSASAPLSAALITKKVLT